MDRRKIRSAGEARQYLAAVAASGKSRVEWARKPGIDTPVTDQDSNDFSVFVRLSWPGFCGP